MTLREPEAVEHRGGLGDVSACWWKMDQRMKQCVE